MTPTSDKDRAALADDLDSLVRNAKDVDLRDPHYSKVLIKAAVALRTPSGHVGGVALQQIHDAINALGGRPEQGNSYDQGIVDTVAKALEIIEKAQTASPNPAAGDGVRRLIDHDFGYEPATIERCARELEKSYPDHAWLNAACAAIRSLASAPLPPLAAEPGPDKEIGKQIGTYLGMSGIDAVDVAFIRNLLSVPPSGRDAVDPVTVEALTDAKLYLESIMHGYQKQRLWSQALEWQGVIDKIDRALSASPQVGGAK